MTGGFVIEPDGDFSLAAAAAFGFGARAAEPGAGPLLRLAFARDDLEGHAGVVVREAGAGRLRVDVQGGGDPAAVERQLRRILSLDHPGGPWLEVGRRDPVIGRLQARHPGLRPLLHHSPYEAAAWGVLSQRRGRAQALAAWRRLADSAGAAFDLAGERRAAFPIPGRLLAALDEPGLDERRTERLRAIAAAAAAGRLDAARLRELGPEAARAELETLPGIGPFWSGLVVVRAAGFADVLPEREPRLLAHVARLYGLDRPPEAEELRALAEPWRPYRTWAAVLIRVDAERAGGV